MKAIIFFLVILMSSPVFAHDGRSESDALYVPVLEQQLKACNERSVGFKVKEDALATCKADLAKSQKEFFKMNVTWIKGVLAGIIVAILLI